MAWAFAIPMALQAVGSLTKGAGQMKGGQATSQAEMYKAAIAQRDAAALGQAAERSVEGGIVNSDIAGLRTAETVGKTLTTQAALNIDPNTRTAANVRASQTEAGRLDQMTTLSDAQLKGWGYRVQQQSKEAQVPLDLASAEGATEGAALGAGGTLLGGASQLPWGWITGGPRPTVT